MYAYNVGRMRLIAILERILITLGIGLRDEGHFFV